MNKKVLGLDIGANFVVGFLLDSIPSPPYKRWYQQHGRDRIHKIKFTNSKKKGTESTGDGLDLSKAVELLQNLKPDVIVLEPTGVWYSALWVRLAESLGIEVKWIGHQDLAYNRGNYGFKDKDDRTDAFCLALSYFDPNFGDGRWLRGRVAIAAELHNRALQLKSIERSRVAQINQLRQRLKLEFPEISKRRISGNEGKDGYTAWIGWLAGIHTYKTIEAESKASLARSLGIEISSYTRDHALSIATLQQREQKIVSEIREFLEPEELRPYVEVLERFGFGAKLQAVIIGAVFPLEKFMVDGKPVIDRWEDDRGKYKRDRSRAAFQMSLGSGKRLVESGQTTAYRYGGSGLCRKQLYVWVNSQILSKPYSDSWLIAELDRRAAIAHHPNQRQQKSKPVIDLYWEWKRAKGGNSAKHKAGIKATMTLSFRITRLLYDELLAAVIKSK
jgi:hypothetical protein